MVLYSFLFGGTKAKWVTYQRPPHRSWWSSMFFDNDIEIFQLSQLIITNGLIFSVTCIIVSLPYVETYARIH